MLKLEGEILYIFPNPKHSEEVNIDILRGEISGLLDRIDLRNKNIKVVGPLTRAQYFTLGFELTYMCKSVEILTENGKFIKCFTSDPTLRE